MPEPLIRVVDLAKDYHRGGRPVAALCGVSLSIDAGEFVAVMGPSGSGKSTLLNLLGCLDRPTTGQYFLNGQDVAGLSDDALAGVRGGQIGFVFQSFNLLARTSALENVELPLLYAGEPAADRRRRAGAALDRMGLGDRREHPPNQLSGGEQQRVAIARALVRQPLLVLADEPTGSLDSGTSMEIMALLQGLNRDGMTIVLVTHDPEIAGCARRIVTLRDGLAVGDVPVTMPAAAASLFAGSATAPERMSI